MLEPRLTWSTASSAFFAFVNEAWKAVCWKDVRSCGIRTEVGIIHWQKQAHHAETEKTGAHLRDRAVVDLSLQSVLYLDQGPRICRLYLLSVAETTE